MLLFRFLLAALFCGTLLTPALSQKSDSNLIYLGLDTLALEGILRNQHEGQSIKFDYPLGVSFDSAQFELVIGGETIAIVPNYLRKTIDEKYVRKTVFIVQNLPDGKVLLRIMKLLDAPKK